MLADAKGVLFVPGKKLFLPGKSELRSSFCVAKTCLRANVQTGYRQAGKGTGLTEDAVMSTLAGSSRALFALKIK